MLSKLYKINAYNFQKQNSIFYILLNVSLLFFKCNCNQLQGKTEPMNAICEQ